MEPDNIIPIATTSHGGGVVFSREERERHVYIVGKSGSGKSTFLFNLAMGDILSGEGVAVIDPHGDLALDILDAIPRSRINDVCYLDVTDSERPVGEQLLSQFHRAVTSLLRNNGGVEDPFWAMTILHEAARSHAQGQRESFKI